MNFNIIVAHCKNNGIGYQNSLPWNIKSDLQKFKTLTTGDGNNCIIMGKNTWNSLNKPLPNRDNLILSKTLNLDYINNNNIIKTFNELESLKDFLMLKDYSEIWIIGGEKIYELFLNSNIIIKNIYITFIDSDFICDTCFPKIDMNKYYFKEKKKHTNKLLNNNDEEKIYDIHYCKY
jgi:dihydrofolate reductase